jgi:hypothetical protein
MRVPGPLGEQAPDGEERHADDLDSTAARLVRLMVAYGVVVAGALLALGSWRDVLVLTASVAASIFLLRSLRAQVSQLDTRDPRAGGLAVLRAVGRFAALALLLLALYELGSGHALAAALGAASLPCALLVETLRQAIRGRARAS